MDKRTQLKELISLLNAPYATKDEVLPLLKALIAEMKKARKEASEGAESVTKELINQALKEIKALAREVNARQGEKGEEGEKGESIKGDKGEPGEDGYTPVKGKDYFDGKDGSPDTGKQIVDKINTLPIEEEYQIDKSHIKGLDEALKSASKSTVVYQGGGVAGRDLFKDIDLSASLDGITKTFNLPAVWNIISVNLSSFPYGSLRKGIDFTYTPTSITFTSEIDAATQLATGQSCVLTVVTA